MNRIALVLALASVAVATPTFDTTNMGYTTPQRNIQQRLGFGYVSSLHISCHHDYMFLTQRQLMQRQRRRGRG
jgi:hypothetical protein